MSEAFLDAIAANLKNAAGAGASRLGAATVANGRVEAEIGMALSRPGPGLSELLTRGQGAGSTFSATHPIPQVVNDMTTQAVDGGVELALGLRR